MTGRGSGGSGRSLCISGSINKSHASQKAYYAKRAWHILRAYENGISMSVLSRNEGISRTRIQQIIVSAQRSAHCQFCQFRVSKRYANYKEILLKHQIIEHGIEWKEEAVDGVPQCILETQIQSRKTGQRITVRWSGVEWERPFHPERMHGFCFGTWPV